MNKSAFARELSSRLGTRVSRQMLDKYHVRGMPFDSADSALKWLAMNSVGEPGRRAGEAMKRDGAEAATSPQPSGATLQPSDDDCGLEPDWLLTVEDGALYYTERHADADIVMLSELLQEGVPQFAQLSPSAHAAVRRAIRTLICRWSGSICCPHCRRAVGIVDPPEPDDELQESA